MSEQFLKKTMKKWDKKGKNLENQEAADNKIEQEYLERKKELAKQLERDMTKFKKSQNTK